MDKSSYAGYADERLRGNFGEMGSWPLVFKYLDAKKTLDIGCSDGLYLQHMAEGSLGIEQIPELVKGAQARGLTVLQDDAMGGLKSIDANSFEAVLFSHVMEHLDCPIEALRQIHRVLDDHGVLVLGLPTEKNFLRHLLGHDYYNGTHLYAFSIRNATRLLELTGFEVVDKFYHLPKCRGAFGRKIQHVWNIAPLPWREYFSMAYWLIARKTS